MGPDQWSLAHWSRMVPFARASRGWELWTCLWVMEASPGLLGPVQMLIKEQSPGQGPLQMDWREAGHVAGGGGDGG